MAKRRRYKYFAQTKKKNNKNQYEQSNQKSIHLEPVNLVNPETKTEQERFDLAFRLARIISGTEDGIPLYELQTKLLQQNNIAFTDVNALRNFLNNFSENFELSLDGNKVKCNQNVSICPTHTYNPGSCQNNCESLHVCKFFLISECKKQNCEFGHDLSDPHNADILKKRLLCNHELFDIRKVMQKYRCKVTIPSVCIHYNKPGGCRHSVTQHSQPPCQYLHVCKHFINGDCKFGYDCMRSHRLHSGQPKSILIQYGLQDIRIYTFRKLIENIRQEHQGNNKPRATFQVNHFDRNSPRETTKFKCKVTESAAGITTSHQDDERRSPGIEATWKYIQDNEAVLNHVSESETKRVEQTFQSYQTPKNIT